MSFLYKDGDLYHFMDMETYEQLPFTAEMLGSSLNFLKENMTCKVVSYKGTVFSVELPLFVELQITQAEPGVKGDTATNATKTVVLETGASVKVPLFVNEGEIIKVDTRSGEYMERVK